MGKRYLLDSNCIIDYIAGLFPNEASDWLNHIFDTEINVSVITKIEVLSYNPDREDNYQVLVNLFEASTVLGLTEDIVDTTIQLRQQQKIKLPDAVIAATSLNNDFILVSRNTKDFKNVEGLELINPYSLNE